MKIPQTSIHNRLGQKMDIRLMLQKHGITTPVFTLHGRSGSFDGAHNAIINEAYHNAGYTVIALNATNSQNNNSDGTLVDFTMQGHMNDLEDTILWAQQGKLARDRNFALAAHSMGGFAALNIASTIYRPKILHVLACAPVTDGTNQIRARYRHQFDVVRDWKKNRFYEEASDIGKDPGKLSFASLMNWRHHTTLDTADFLTMPVHIISGTADIFTPPEDIAEFLKHAPDHVTAELIEGADHTFSNHLDYFRTRVEAAIAALPKPEIQLDDSMDIETIPPP